MFQINTDIDHYDDSSQLTSLNFRKPSSALRTQETLSKTPTGTNRQGADGQM